MTDSNKRSGRTPGIFSDLGTWEEELTAYFKLYKIELEPEQIKEHVIHLKAWHKAGKSIFEWLYSVIPEEKYRRIREKKRTNKKILDEKEEAKYLITRARNLQLYYNKKGITKSIEEIIESLSRQNYKLTYLSTGEVHTFNSQIDVARFLKCSSPTVKTAIVTGLPIKFANCLIEKI